MAGESYVSKISAANAQFVDTRFNAAGGAKITAVRVVPMDGDEHEATVEVTLSMDLYPRQADGTLPTTATVKTYTYSYQHTFAKS